MKRFWKSYEARITGLFLLSLVVYLVIAWWFHAPRGYYGTIEQPRFADPWVARSETILSGGLLYRDVSTTTPPLTNFLLIAPSLVAKWFGYLNPWMTLSFMLYFSLFNLLTAFVLFRMGRSPREGWVAAAVFLLNPLTFGNAVLRRQDESILTFFFALALFLVLRRQHLRAAVAIGATILIKLTGLLLIPIGLLHGWNWRYLVITILLIFVVLAPFLILAGQDAMFWDFGRREAEHPFQLGGVSLGALWNKFHDDASSVRVQTLSVIFLLGVGITGALVAWARLGVLEDLTVLLAAVLLLTPKLHTGYFSLLALTMAPLVLSYRLGFVYFALGGVAIVADFYKWPVENFRMAFGLMAAVSVLLAIVIVRLLRSARSDWVRAEEPADGGPPSRFRVVSGENSHAC